MKTLAILLICSVPAFAQWQRSERIIEVPQPPVTVRQYVPQDVEVPQPPLRYKEVTESRSYTVPLQDEQPAFTYRPVFGQVQYAAPVYVGAKVYAAPTIYAVPLVYAAPRRKYATPIRSLLFGDR